MIDGAPPIDAPFSVHLSVSVAGPGSGTVQSAVDGITCPPTCSADLPKGTVVELVAVPTYGSELTAWAGACAGAAETCTITLDSDTDVTAAFDYATRTVTVMSQGAGTGRIIIDNWQGPIGSPIDCGNVCSAEYAVGGRVWVHSLADFGSRLGEWLVCGDEMNVDHCGFEITQDATAVALFHLGTAWGQGGTDRAHVVDIAPDGSIYLAGKYTERVVFGDRVGLGESIFDPPYGFLVKLSGANHDDGVWAKNISEFTRAMAVDDAGNAITATAYNKYSPGYTWLIQRWRGIDGERDRSNGGYGEAHVRALAANSVGGVAVIGNFLDTVRFDDKSVTSSGNHDIFIGKLWHYAWEMLWLRRYGGPAQDIPRAVAFDANDDLWVVGTFRETASFGGEEFSAVDGNASGFVAHYDGGTGAHIASWQLSSSVSNVPKAIAVTDAGNIRIAGSFHGSANFGGEDILSPEGYGVYVAEFDSSGNHVKSWGVPGNTGGTRLQFDADGNVIMAISFTGTIDSPAGAFTSGGSTDVLVAKLDAGTGAVLWAKHAGGPSTEEILGLASNDDGAVFAAGSFAGDSDFGPSTNGGYDILLWPLNP